jgi:hypothetical protein
MLIDKLKIKKPGTYTIKVNNLLEIESVKLDLAGKYIVDVNNEQKTVSITHNGNEMTNRSTLDPNDENYIDPKKYEYKPWGFEKMGDPILGDPFAPTDKLGHGCVGLCMLSQVGPDDPCVPVWDGWF